MPNPIDSWTWPQVVAGVALLFVGTVLGAGMIQRNDAALASTTPSRSGALQYRFTASAAGGVVEHWSDAGVVGVASRGTVIDTFVLVPMYSTLLAVLCFAAARGFGEGAPWQRVALTLGWGGWAAGMFDLIENTGIFAELHLDWYGIAPLVGTASSLKWTCIGVDVVFLVGWIASQAWQLAAA